MGNDDRMDNLPETTTTDFQSGAVVFGKFRIVELIGTGGMGRVYKVIQKDLKKEMALKVIHGRVNDGTNVLRFQNEARAVSRLSHVNVANVYDFGVSELGQPYMAMEFVDGSTLDRIISLEGKIDLEQFLDILIQVCAALEHAHSKGIIHRDIKPGNIMIADTDEGSVSVVKVLDFGIAKSTDAQDGALTKPGDVLGSPLYMSPDMVRGIPATNKSDLYSLGCVMFKCLTGRTPFRGDTSLETIQLHQMAPVPSPRADMSASKITDALSELVERLLAKNPEERPDSAGTVRSALMQMREVLSADKKTLPPVEAAVENIVQKPAGRRKWIAGGISLAVIVAGTMIALTLRSVEFEGKNKDQILMETLDKKLDTAYKDKSGQFRKILSESHTGAYFANLDLVDDDLASLEDNRILRMLDLTENEKLTDAGLMHIRNLRLTNLSLEGTSVVTLLGLRTMITMYDMGLANTPVTDAAMDNLLAMKNLTVLSLAGTKVTYTGVRKLARHCTALQKVDLLDCKINANELKQLREEFPNCNFVVDKM